MREGSRAVPAAGAPRGQGAPQRSHGTWEEHSGERRVAAGRPPGRPRPRPAGEGSCWRQDCRETGGPSREHSGRWLKRVLGGTPRTTPRGPRGRPAAQRGQHSGAGLCLHSRTPPCESCQLAPPPNLLSLRRGTPQRGLAGRPRDDTRFALVAQRLQSTSQPLCPDEAGGQARRPGSGRHTDQQATGAHWPAAPSSLLLGQAGARSSGSPP